MAHWIADANVVCLASHPRLTASQLSRFIAATPATQVTALLDRNDIPASLLHLEITETTIMADPIRARYVVECLRLLGLTVAVDDYGTGYSSLAYLRDLSVGELKLDRGFLQGICADLRAAAIVRSTVDLAHSLGMRMVAEGVESSRAARVLAELGCDVAQGFHYSRPLPAVEFERWLTNTRHAATPGSGNVPRSTHDESASVA